LDDDDHNNHSNNNSEPALVMVDNGGESVISVHATLVIGGYIGCFASAVFSVLLVAVPPGPVNANGSLRFISEGMNQHCGLANVLMGTFSLLVLACQLVVAAHLASPLLGWCAALQTLGWNVVLGVVDTGWTIHSAALVVFLLSHAVFHTLVARHRVYGGPIYAVTNGLTWVFGVVFVSVGLTSMALGEGYATLRSFAVAFEFVLMLLLTIESACMVSALDQFRDIHLRLDHQ